MFKLAVITALLALASARPSIFHDAHHLVKTTIIKSAPIFHTQHVIQKAIISEPTQIAVQEPYLAKIGERVETIPTSYSHVYRSDVHSKALVKDIIAPVVKTYIQPVVKHIEVKPIIAHAEAAVIIEEPKIVKKIEKEVHIEHAAEAVVSAPVIHTESSASLSVASADAVVAAPAEVYGLPKLAAESFTTVDVKAPVVHAEAHAIVDTKAHAIVDAKAHAIVDTKAHAIVDTKAHAIVDAKAHAIVDTKAHAIVDTKAHAIVDAKAHAVVDVPAVPFTSYEAPLGPVHADAKASAITIAHVPSREYGVPNIKAEAFAEVNAPYPASI